MDEYAKFMEFCKNNVDKISVKKIIYGYKKVKVDGKPYFAIETLFHRKLLGLSLYLTDLNSAESTVLYYNNDGGLESETGEQYEIIKTGGKASRRKRRNTRRKNRRSRGRR